MAEVSPLNKSWFPYAFIQECPYCSDCELYHSLCDASDVFDVVSAKDVQFLSDNSVHCTVCKQEENPVASRAREYKIVCRNKKEITTQSQEAHGPLCYCSSVSCNWFVRVQFWLGQAVTSTEDSLSICNQQEL